jgi:hypothetical protein
MCADRRSYAGAPLACLLLVVSNAVLISYGTTILLKSAPWFLILFSTVFLGNELHGPYEQLSVLDPVDGCNSDVVEQASSHKMITNCCMYKLFDY